MESKEKREYFKLPNKKVNLYTSLMCREGILTQDNKVLLVLLNGFGRSFLDFQSLRKSLHKRHDNLVTLSLDNRFSGRTQVSNDEDASIPTMAEDVLFLVKHFMEKFNFKSFNLLGISMGGMIAQCVAASSPFLNKLILVSTTLGGSLRVYSKEAQSKAFDEHSKESFKERFSKYV